jgi:hypothetical protein
MARRASLNWTRFAGERTVYWSLYRAYRKAPYRHCPAFAADQACREMAALAKLASMYQEPDSFTAPVTYRKRK